MIKIWNKSRFIKILRQRGLLRFLLYTINLIKKTIYLLLSIFTIKKLRKRYTPESLVEFVFSYYEGLISPLQIRSEILNLLKVLLLNPPKVIIEIGTARGGTLFLFSKIAREDVLIISIDLPGGKYGLGYPRIKIPLYKSFVTSEQELHLLRFDSHNLDTLKRVKQILKGKKVDFLFIDGDHTYEGVKKDFELYSPLVHDNGIIAFHDIACTEFDLNIGVYKLWDEIKQNYENKEFIEQFNKDSRGIGVLKEKKIIK